MASKRLTVRLRGKLWEHVEFMSKALGSNYSEAVRHIIEDHMIWFKFKQYPPFWAVEMEKRLYSLPVEDAKQFIERALETLDKLVEIRRREGVIRDPAC